MPTEYTPRLSVEISEETFKRMQDRIPWGLRTKVMSILLEDLLSLVESHGNVVLAAVLDRRIGAQDVVKELRGKELKDGT
ncbi:MAG: hypothetical protein WC208_17060 [Gallionella sp.]|jgi:hypothetical protein